MYNIINLKYNKKVFQDNTFIKVKQYSQAITHLALHYQNSSSLFLKSIKSSNTSSNLISNTFKIYAFSCS
ncbi:hypothetical protein Hanom_Chr12g01085831 [Helianthus anomalus]